MHKNLRSWRKFSGSRRFLGFGYSSRQACPELSRRDAKALSSEEKKNNPQTNSLLLIQPLRLGVLAGDIPRLTGTPPGGFEPQGGARSAPYENLRVLRAFVVNPTFLILVAAVPH
jgi:hypothetical protein